MQIPLISYNATFWSPQSLGFIPMPLMKRFQKCPWWIPWWMPYQKSYFHGPPGALCNAGNSDKKYGGTREDASVTVSGKFNCFSSKMQLSSPGDHISVVFGVKLLLKLIWLKVSSAFNLGQRQQWNFPSLSCGAWHQHLSGNFQQRS